MGSRRQTMTHITHTSARLDAIICLKGAPPSIETIEHFADVPIIAADGAANLLHELDILPEYVVGDLDSVMPHVLDAMRDTTEVIVEIDQDINDFEKALRFAQQMLWKRILVTGIHGGDLEHTLNNWSVLMRYGKAMEILALEGSRIGIPLYKDTSYQSEIDEVISLIPQPTATLTTRGLHWQLSQEVLSLGVREGARNRSSDSTIELEIHDGAVFMFVDARLPQLPVADASAILHDES
jgi:thiamine pyrophosphokinase